jgi:hypothetical protein
MDLHPDAHNISARLKKEGITALYHFTSVENLPLVSQHQALSSKEVLESNGDWPVPQPGGNERSHALDRQKGNWDFVSLNFTPHTPMAYDKKKVLHLCFMEISTDVAFREGVIFTDSNATYHAHNRGEGMSGLELVNFEMVRSDPLPWNREWFEKYSGKTAPHAIQTTSPLS